MPCSSSRRGLNGQADVYSLGVLARQTLTGKSPSYPIPELIDFCVTGGHKSRAPTAFENLDVDAPGRGDELESPSMRDSAVAWSERAAAFWRADGRFGGFQFNQVPEISASISMRLLPEKRRCACSVVENERLIIRSM